MVSVISNYIDELSSTQLYTAIVGATVTLCIVLLGPAAGGNETLPNNMLKRTILSKDNANNSNSNNNSNNALKQQPKWYLFKYINVGVFCMFVSSVAVFLWDASTYIHNGDRMTQFLLGWSLFLCYFFGFFGVFFIHQDLLLHHQTHGDTEDDKAAKDLNIASPKGFKTKDVAGPKEA